MPEHVHIIGAGVVGSATGRALASVGHQVSFVDVNEDRVATMAAEGFGASTSLQLPGDRSTVVLLSVPTPSTGSSYDLSIMEDAARSAGRAFAADPHPHVVVVRSTVTPTFCDTLLTPWLEESSSKRAGEDFFVVSAPEFLREDRALDDALNPWVTVVGAHDENARQRVAEVFAPLGGKEAIFDNPTVAEMIKIVHNCFNAAKISFWNEIWRLCEHLGVDQRQVGQTVAMSAEGSFNPSYGIKGGYPYGGACLPKDLDGLLGLGAAQGVELPLLAAVKVVNQMLAEGR